MITYFILVHCTFLTNFSNKLKLKSQFQLSFDEDSLPLKMSPFQVSLCTTLRTVSSLMDGRGIPAFTITPFFTKKFSISFLQVLGLSEDISVLSNRQFLWSSLIICRSSLMQIVPVIMGTYKMELFVNI